MPENTVLFIASDHSVSMVDFTDATKGINPIVFMAVNTTRTEHITRTIGQVNIYPAVLELLGIKGAEYNGLAPSAFNPSVNGTITSYGEIIGNPSKGAVDTLRHAYRISDLIIRGDYFRR